MFRFINHKGIEKSIIILYSKLKFCENYGEIFQNKLIILLKNGRRFLSVINYNK